MSVLQEFLCECHGALSSARTRKAIEVPHGEVAGVRCHHIEKAGLGFGVAESGNSFDLFLRHFHSDKISAVNSRWSRTRRRFETSLGWALMENPARTFSARWRPR